MPKSLHSHDDAFASTMANLLQRVTRLEQQQNSGVRDAQGNLRLQEGLLPNGDYGLAFYDANNDGGFKELFPSTVSYFAGLITTTSLTYAAGTGSPTVEPTLGAHGDGLIIVSANIGINSANDTGSVGISIDGAPPGGDTIWASASASLIATSACLVLTVAELNGGTPLTPGPHSFTMQQRGSTAGHTFNFSRNALVVWPF